MSCLTSLREKANLTQEELAGKSGVSVRTIQRVESGAVPKGHTLKALALSLGVEVPQLLGTQEKPNLQNLTLLKIINLSSLPSTFFPPANILLPLLIMFVKKRFDPMAKQLLSLQILNSLLAFIIFMGGAFLQKWLGLQNWFMLAVMGFLIISNLTIILINSAALDKHGKLRIRLGFNLI
ncbi:helix-turn-helix domain-containing protein [Litoribacter populi]|uniref:helix-turn-helix domain-containing protein n=1 Tax=Litoribacter populi TaxID=2598460 RepID=UPI00117EAC95|nr:helix-turn-helix transcriptional regulator [Litoribacter populi]